MVVIHPMCQKNSFDASYNDLTLERSVIAINFVCMYPWSNILNSWAQGIGLRIDALGLVTFLGAEEMDRSVGRLMPSEYLDYLPLLGAFTVAGNRFTEKKTGYSLYNISAGVMTSELAGWFSRWIQAQPFHRVRSKVSWEVVDRPRRWKPFFIGFIFIGLPLNGMLIALTVLAADWWGFANAIAMIISVMVRCAQVAENQVGVDWNIQMARERAEKDLVIYERLKTDFEGLRRQGKINGGTKMPARPKDHDHVKVIVATEDSKVITISAPGFLIKPAFTANPHIPNRLFYLTCRVVGWAAFAVHVISIGMAALHTQICSVVLMIVPTILTAYRVGCEDSQIGRIIWNKMRQIDKQESEWSCWVTSRLKATISSYPVEHTHWDLGPKESNAPTTPDVTERTQSWSWNRRKSAMSDLEHCISIPRPQVMEERRQDLYAWLDLTQEEDERMVAWGLIPHSREWMAVYLEKKEKHRHRKTLVKSISQRVSQ